jgi:hypothetical protein
MSEYDVFRFSIVGEHRIFRVVTDGTIQRLQVADRDRTLVRKERVSEGILRQLELAPKKPEKPEKPEKPGVAALPKSITLIDDKGREHVLNLDLSS